MEKTYKQFKVGDRVRLVDCDWSDYAHRMWTIATVIDAWPPEHPSSQYVRVRFTVDGFEHKLLSSRFELVENEQSPSFNFKVGDEVRLISNHTCPGKTKLLDEIHSVTQRLGQSGTVIKARSDSLVVTVKFGIDGYEFSTLAWRFELVKDEKAPSPKFKAGDRVNLVNSDSCFSLHERKGCKATITHVDDGGYVKIRFDNGGQSYISYRADRFELLEESNTVSTGSYKPQNKTNKKRNKHMSKIETGLKLLLSGLISLTVILMFVYVSVSNRKEQRKTVIEAHQSLNMVGDLNSFSRAQCSDCDKQWTADSRNELWQKIPEHCGSVEF